MNASNLSSGDISALIDYVLKSKEPAAVGLRKVIKKMKGREEGFPLQPAQFEEFSVEGRNGKKLSHDDRIIIELEKQINDLRLAVERERKKAARSVRDAYEKGLVEGTEKGGAAAYKKAADEYNVKIDELQKRLHGFCLAVENSKKSLYVDAHKSLLAFCFEFAKKIISTEVSVNPDIILSVIQKAISYIADRERIVIRVAKDDMETVSGKKDFWAPVEEHLQSIVIEKDDRIEKGGCIIESNSGIADARLGVQFEELKEVVEKAWESISPQSVPPHDSAHGNLL